MIRFLSFILFWPIVRRHRLVPLINGIARTSVPTRILTMCRSATRALHRWLLWWLIVRHQSCPGAPVVAVRHQTVTTWYAESLFIL